MIPTRIGVIESTGAVFKISYSLGGDAASKSLDIYVNSSPVVGVTTNTSGEITINPGDILDVYAAGSDTVNIALSLTVVNSGTTVYNNFQSGDLSFSDFYNYTPTGNGSITVIAGTI